MSESTKPKGQAQDAWDWDFDGTRRHHIRRGLQLTPAERLRWLEETVDEMRQIQGLACLGRTSQDT